MNKLLPTLMIAAGVVFLLTTCNQAQETKDKAEKLPPKVAPIYALPKDGTWVRYDFFYRDRRGKELEGTMQIKSDGTKKIGEKKYRWIEIKMENPTILTRIGRFLIEEDAVLSGKPLEKHVHTALHQEGDRGKVTLLNEKEISNYFTMGVQGSLHEISEKETLKTRLGPLVCRHVSTKGRGYQRPAQLTPEKDKKATPMETPVERQLEYRAWLNKQVPFGWARFEVWAQQAGGATVLVFSAEVVEKSP